MSGVYRDDAAWRAAVAERGADELVYWVDDHRYQEGPGALIVGTSTLLPGRIGDEFAVTRGHLHAVADRAELYHCLSGRGVMLLETLDGQSAAIELTPGKAVNVPGHWIHRSVNVGDEPFVTLFCYAADAGQDYAVISDAGGMQNLVVADGDGWTLTANPDHTGYPRP
ncbi:cupin domain-containing protein [Microbacterium sp. Re1]|uniref:glucose-6-phosphate isomerase n=2 Tax=Microbacteriaceae TaxID=85023 RepID=A0ABR8W4U6_9MICO|nr:cupin domain-containing protein [Microbacterium commune]